MALTKLTDLINPEVMADMISAKLPAAIKFAPLAGMDTTLEGSPGDTITVPRYEYIGDAVDAEGGVAIESSVLKTLTVNATIKEIRKDVDILDSAINSAYGDPVGQIEKQLAMAIASKVDADCIAVLKDDATLVLDRPAAIIGYTGIVDGVDLFQEEEEELRVLFVHPKQMTQLRKDADFIKASAMGDKVIMSGVVGEIAGCQVVQSKRVPFDAVAQTFTNFIVKEGALKIYSKAKAMVEVERNAKLKTNLISANQYFTAVLENASRAVKLVFATGVLVMDALDAAKVDAAALVEGTYTAESWAVLVAALALAEATQAEINAKTVAIADAIDALVTA